MKSITLYILSSLFLFYLLSFWGCSAGRTTTERKEEGKKEVTFSRDIKNIELEERTLIKKLNIRSVDRLSFDLEGGKPANRRRLATVTHNKEGFPVETINYDDEGKPESIYTYKYDRSGKRIETLRSSPAGVEEKRFTYEYNEYGNKVRSERYDMLGNMEKYYIYEYDDEGKLVEDIWYDKSGKREYRIEYEYDRNGRKNKVKSFNENNRLVYEYELLYDNKGNLVEEVRIDPSGNKTGIIQYMYQYF